MNSQNKTCNVQKQYCKSRGLKCNTCNYEKCIDSRGKDKEVVAKNATTERSK